MIIVTGIILLIAGVVACVAIIPTKLFIQPHGFLLVVISFLTAVLGASMVWKPYKYQSNQPQCTCECRKEP